ncbi:MAG: hypothetical protein WBP93_08760, partial [Pyrinomonadaceae bacterium]
MLSFEEEERLLPQAARPQFYLNRNLSRTFIIREFNDACDRAKLTGAGDSETPLYSELRMSVTPNKYSLE